MADPVTLGALALTAAGAGISAAGTIAGGNAAADAGRRSQQAMEFRARQEEQAATEARAVGQRAGFEKQREGKLALSALTARAAGSGTGVDSATNVGLAQGIAGRSEYDTLFDMFKGENRGRGLEDEAMGSRLTGEAALAEGRAKKSAAMLSAAGTIVGASGSMYRTYKKIPEPRYG